MKLETDSRLKAFAYLNGQVIENPCPVARPLIRNLLEDLFAANGEIRHLQRERAELLSKILKEGA